MLDALSYLRDHGHDRVAKLMLIDETPKMAADPANPEEWGEVPLTHDGMPAFILFLSTDRDGFLSYISSRRTRRRPRAGRSRRSDSQTHHDGAQTPEHIAIIAGLKVSPPMCRRRQLTLNARANLCSSSRKRHGPTMRSSG